MATSASISIVAVATVLPVLDIIAVVLRISVTRFKWREFGKDDYLIAAALVVVICSCASYAAGAIIGGFGHHIADLKLDNITMTLKIVFALQITYLLSVTLIKLSILLFYKRIFVTPKFGVAIRIMCALILIWFITFFFATLFQTLPISNNFVAEGSASAPGTVINVYAMYTTTAVLEILLDIVTLILPLFVIWRLQMRATQKWQVSGVFLLGSFVCVASILRLYYLIQHLNPSVEEEEDLTYSIANIILWSAIEPCVGIICACLPTLGPIFQRRTLQAIVKSVVSFFAIHSKGSSDSQFSLPTVKEHVTRKSPSDSKARQFYPLDDEQSLVTTVQPSSENERGPEEFPLESIMVNSRLERNVEQRRL